MTDTIASILSGGAFTRQQADALRQLLERAGGASGAGARGVFDCGGATPAPIGTARIDLGKAE